MTNGKTILETKKKRLQSYYDREALMLSPDGIKSYGIGTRNASRYETALKEIQDMIKTLETEISEIENPVVRKAVRVIQRDW